MSEGQIDHLWGEGQGQTMSPSSIPSRRFRRLILWVLICFFLSGMTGLMYELLWTRMIVKIIGGAPFAVTIILTVFMGGLGLGSFLAGRWIDRINNPRQLLRCYGVLEIAIAGYALVIPALLHHPAHLMPLLCLGAVSSGDTHRQAVRPEHDRRRIRRSVIWVLVDRPAGHVRHACRGRGRQRSHWSFVCDGQLTWPSVGRALGAGGRCWGSHSAAAK